jgi:hypothetical protein
MQKHRGLLFIGRTGLALAMDTKIKNTDADGSCRAFDLLSTSHRIKPKEASLCQRLRRAKRGLILPIFNPVVVDRLSVSSNRRCNCGYWNLMPPAFMKNIKM